MRFSNPLVAVLALTLFLQLEVSAQVGIGTTTPSQNAVLELKSPGNNQGFLVPRLTTAERLAITSLTANDKGLLVFDSNDDKFYYWSGTAWIIIVDSVGTGTVTNIATGAGLTGGPITVTGTISLADNGVTTIKLADGSVTTAKITDGTITTTDILDGTIGTLDLADGSITSVKVVDGTLVATDLADGSVTTVKILDGTIATADLADGSVTSVKITDGTISNADVNAAAAIAVTKLAVGTNGQVLTTVAGAPAWAALPDASSLNEIQDLTLATNTLSLSGDATTVNLAPYLDNTDAQNLSLGAKTGTQQPINISGGTGVTIDVADNDNNASNEIQDLSLATNTLSLSGDATTVNLAPYLDNTDAQTIAFTSPNLSISGGNSINLSGINTDNQDLILTGNTLSLTNDASTVSLAGYLDNTDAQNLSLGVKAGTVQPINISGGTGISIDVADNDNSTSNEIQDLNLAANILSLTSDASTVNLAPYLDNTDNQDLTLAGNTLSLTNDASTVSLAGYLDNTDAQNLSLGVKAGTVQPINISGGTGISIDVADNDNSVTNEIQDLSLAGNTLTLSGDATTVSLAGYLDNTDAQDLANVLNRGNDAKTQAAVNFSALSVNTLATDGALNVIGSHYMSFTLLPAGTDVYDVQPTDYIIIGRSSVAKPYNVILPKASASRGRVLVIRSTGVGTSDGIQVVSTETIDGAPALPIMFTEANNVYAVTVMSDGKDWYTISKSRY